MIPYWLSIAENCDSTEKKENRVNPLILSEIVPELLQIENFSICRQILREWLKTEKILVKLTNSKHLYSSFSMLSSGF